MKRRHFIAGAGALATVGAGAYLASAQRSFAASLEKDAAAEALYPPLGKIYLVDGQQVHATDEGSGRPVVMIHGASGNLRDFTFNITGPLSQSYRVIAMDRPGFGYSTRATDDQAWSPFAQAAQLRAATKMMGIERPIIVGHSWGATVALAWALDAPEEVAGVVSASGAMMPWNGIVDFLGAIGVGEFGARRYSERLSKTAEEGGIANFIARAFRPQSPPPGYIDYVGGELAVREKTLRANTQDFANLQRAMRRLEPRYDELTTPLEVIHGDRDWLLSYERHALGMADRAPHANLTKLTGVGHMAHHASPQALADAIGRIAEATA
ncbi:MAG: alpha/beta hydrolase [Pseudomonadota bacterium]